MLRLLKNRRVWLGVLVVGGLIAMAAWPRTTEVEVGRATRATLRETIDEDGRTRVRERFVLTSPVSGELLRIDLQPGDAVRKGARLAVVRPAPPAPLDARTRAEAEAAIRSAEAALGRARAEQAQAATARDLAKRDLARSQALAAGGAVAREEVERMTSQATAADEAVRAAEFVVAQAQHELEVARARVENADATGAPHDWVILAPVDGVVLARHHESQSVVPAGEPLLDIGDPARLEIVSDLLSTDAVRVTAGSPVLIEQWGGASTLQGRVRRIEPSAFTKVSALGVEEQRVNAVIDFDQPPPALGDNFRVEVRIIVWEGDQVLTVPPGALFRRGEGWAVFAVDAGHARVRPVDIGHRNAEQVQILGGLEEGAPVVLYPPDTLDDGAWVAARSPAS